MTIRVGIVGATGYAGEALFDILLRHPSAAITGVYSRSGDRRAFSELFPRFKGRTGVICSPLDVKKIVNDSDAVFLSLPHTVSMELVPHLVKAGKKVIDLSADYRLRDPAVYRRFYKIKHKDAGNIKRAVYGLPELYRAKIKTAGLIANPGCYPTAAILALFPLLALGAAEHSPLIIDAKSGASGAGKNPSGDMMFSEVHDDFRAYKVNCHQHAPEITQELTRVSGKKTGVIFVPHLLPLTRGILETIYLRSLPGQKRSTGSLVTLYKKFYKTEPFVRIKDAGSFPRLKETAGTNFCDIGIQADGADIIVISAIDNLIKGAAGQAVQNFNIMYGFPETTALL
ncbi:MAG: N-acetyl-gamma-glutamyl-phosphate reductase [Candidatus Omnitrophica bacterium]|nr:N-acetyl-gamma-glutamyl-phosphate reductase [Candidatus Omnitrophota bacterium]